MASFPANRAMPDDSAARFELVRASLPAQLSAAAALRQRVFQERYQLGFDEALEARRDRTGHVFLLYERGAAIAVGRVLPYPSPLSTLVDLSRVAGAHGADSEIGRVACLASSQTPRCAVRFLTLGSLWLLGHTRLRRYVGYCRPRLLGLYRALGAVPQGEVRARRLNLANLVPSGRSELANLSKHQFSKKLRTGNRYSGEFVES